MITTPPPEDNFSLLAAVKKEGEKYTAFSDKLSRNLKWWFHHVSRAGHAARRVPVGAKQGA
uniref:Uncharacterized protein n=1 Tax=Erwinia amylovora ATCC BAA-2158 TaxID=889211 RepID=E5B6D6_ERWAM|nr:hypothetical protein predicted by Glimmer/Critica [Erwinia amylovora ATCC BAA-2158]